MAQAPQTATTQSTKQVYVLAQKYARAGNLSKASQTICSTLKPALKPDTLDKLKAKNLQDSTDFDSRHGRRQTNWMMCVVMMTGKKLKPKSFLLRRLGNISPAARH